MNHTESYHQVIIRSDNPTNTGPVKLYSRVVNIKWGKAEEYIKNNPQVKVIKVIDVKR